MDWTTIITNSSITASLLFMAGLTAKKWIGARVEESVKHTYAKMLEEHKIQLQVESQGSVDRRAADKALFGRFLEDLPSDGSIYFLRTHHMGASFELESLEELFRFRYVWEQPERHFLDAALDKKRRHLHERISEFIDCSKMTVFPLDSASLRFSVPREWQHTQPKRHKEEVDKLHSLAALVVEAHEDFVKTTRENLKC